MENDASSVAIHRLMDGFKVFSPTLTIIYPGRDKSIAKGRDP
jgi:hypothetical protein